MAEKKIEEARIELYGRVQGVLFRDRVKKYADSLGLKGYVQNRRDGSVLLVLQGARERINEMLDWINTSPMPMSINKINFSREEANVAYRGFDIMRDKGFFADKKDALVNLGKSLLGISADKVPVHIAIIPDGNRRWAREKGLEASQGHYKAGSYDNMVNLFEECKKLGVKYLSFWGFSTENWKRDKKELDALFGLISDWIPKFGEEARKREIRFRHVGRKDRLSREIVRKLEKLEKETAGYKSFNVLLCLDYGGRDEIVRAVNRIIKSGARRVDESKFENYLDTAGVPDVDLIIRTSGEQRTSGLMPFQSAYAELYFTDCYFPDFNAGELRKAVEEYGRRVRRFGGTAKEDLKK